MQKNTLKENLLPRPKEQQKPALPKLAVNLKLKEKLKVMLRKASLLKKWSPFQCMSAVLQGGPGSHRARVLGTYKTI